VRIENDIDPARVAVAKQYALPRLATISRPENSSLLVRSEGVPERRDECDVRVLRVDDDRANVTRVDKPANTYAY